MFLTMFSKKQNIVLTMPLTMLIAHPYTHKKGALASMKPYAWYALCVG